MFQFGVAYAIIGLSEKLVFVKQEVIMGAVAYRVQGYRGFSAYDNKDDYNVDEIVYFDDRFSREQIDKMLACSIFDVDKYRCVAYEFEKIED